MLTKVGGLLALDLILLAVMEAVTGYGVLATGVTIVVGMWGALLIGAVWVSRGARKGYWQCVRAWLWSGGVRVLAALGSVVVAIRVLGSDSGVVVVCLAVVYLPMLFYETAVVNQWLRLCEDSRSLSGVVSHPGVSS